MSAKPAAVRRVLIADDDELSRVLLTYILEELHCAVVSVADGHAAIKVCQTDPFDLGILAYRMPHDGIRTMSAIRSDRHIGRRANFPLVICSASAMPHDIQLYLREGADDVLVKPIGMTGVSRILARWIINH